MPDPKLSNKLFTHATMLPSRSAVDRTTVSPPVSVLRPAAVADARAGSTRGQSVFAYAFESSRATGTVAKSGSALKAYRSLYASFFASTTRCQYFGLTGPSDASVCPG